MTLFENPAMPYLAMFNYSCFYNVALAMEAYLGLPCDSSGVANAPSFITGGLEPEYNHHYWAILSYDYDCLNRSRLVYVYRDPVYVIYSNLVSRGKLSTAKNDLYIPLAQYCSHVQSFLKIPDDGRQQIIEVPYEDIVDDFNATVSGMGNAIRDWHMPENNKWWIKDLDEDFDDIFLMRPIEAALNIFNRYRRFVLDEAEISVKFEDEHGEKIRQIFEQETGLKYG